MNDLPLEAIDNIADYCDGSTLNSLARINNLTNTAVNCYPSQVYQHIKRLQPNKLAEDILPLIDPLNLITYQSNLPDLSNVEVINSDINYHMMFCLGKVILFDIKILVSEIYTCLSNYGNLEMIRRYDGLNHRLGVGGNYTSGIIGFSGCIIKRYCDYKLDNGVIELIVNGVNSFLVGPGSDKSSHFYFKSYIFDVIVDELIEVLSLYKKVNSRW